MSKTSSHRNFLRTSAAVTLGGLVLPTVLVMLTVAAPQPAAAQELKGIAESGAAKTENAQWTKVVLNGTEYGFNAQSGCLESIVHPVAGQLLRGTGERAGLIDMAFPLGTFEILRVSNRWSKDAKIAVSEGKVEIQYEALGQNFPAYTVEGGVKVCVTLWEAPDGVSVILSAKVENASSNMIRQVLFPDLDGIPPKEGMDGTFFTSCGGRSKPFLELKAPKYGEKTGFYEAVSVGGQTLSSGGISFSKMIGRWFDIGGYKGGLSLYERWWKWGPDGHNTQTKFWQRLDQQTDLLRIAVMHDIDIPPGASWESCEYWLTPHAYGWAEGIKPYAEWVRQNSKRVVPMPKHIKEGLGFRTLWMAQQYPEEPSSTIWKYKDIVGLAQESKEHGIDEIVLWAFVYWTLPFGKDKILENLGSYEDLKEAVAESRKMGVNIVPFVSFISIWNETCARYGMTPGGPDSSWNYHTKLIPVFRPRYGISMTNRVIDQNNELWQQDVKDSFAAFRELGFHSISWDQLLLEYGKEKGIPRLVEEFRKEMSAIDPESTFSGESCYTEWDGDYLDYTWNWFYYRPKKSYEIPNHYPFWHYAHLTTGYYPGKTDLRAHTNAFSAPRANVLIDSDPMDVKYCFADNLYMCPCPTKPGDVLGTARYSERPELSAALKQCAALRKQFLEYFTDGTIIGDCVLTSECNDAHITAYHLGKKILIIVLCESDEKSAKRINVEYDLSCWLGTGAVTLKTYDSWGKQVGEKKGEVKGNLTFEMKYGEFSFIEISK